MVISETHFICDGCEARQSRKGTAIYEPNLPEGWHYLQATRDGARCFVKLVCKKCFDGLTREFFPKPWGAPNEGRSDPERHS